jgi:hypothetical protein
MLERLRTQIGTAGLVVAIVALVAALGGGAYAATGGNSGKATASAKQGKQGKQGKTGKTGPAGPAGTAGPAGPAGAKGDTGAAGSNGKDGTNGTNGKNGTNGTNGSPWTAGGTLPEGATETGSWALPEGPPGQFTAISFAVPLSEEFDGTHTKYIPAGGTPPAECENSQHAGGASPANPEATNGFLCVYAAVGEVAGPGVLSVKAGSAVFSVGMSTGGAVFIAGGAVTKGTPGYAGGTWAVTAP